MPVQNSNFAEFTDTTAARNAALKAMGLAMQQVQAPNCPVDTGNLRRSVTMKVNAAGGYVDVGPTADYGGYVHNGTKKRKGRPWLREAAQRNAQAIGKAGTDAFTRELGR